MSPRNSEKPSGRKPAAGRGTPAVGGRGKSAAGGKPVGGGKPAAGGRGGSARGAVRAGAPAGRNGAPAGRSGAPAGRGGAPRGRGGRDAARDQQAEISRAKWTQSSGLGGEQVEGRHAVRELLIADRRKVKEVWVAQGMDDNDIIDDIIDMCRQRRIAVHEVSRQRIEAESRSDNPQGVLAMAQPFQEDYLEEMCETQGDIKPFLLAFDGVTDPHNVGSLIRTGECAGITGIILTKHRSAHITPTVAKVSAGAVEHLPMALVPGLPAAMAEAKERGVWTVGLDMDGDVDISDVAVADQPIMLVMGAEGTGLSQLTKKRCDVIARIPQYGSVASLNVAAAGAIACFEIAKKRG